MSIEFIGFIGNRAGSESRAPQGPVLDLRYVETLAKAQEYAGFDRALLAFHSDSPESLLVAAHAASVTETLGFMVAHRPGFTAPSVAARQFATFDVISGGRASIHVITGGNDEELRRDGSFLPKDERYARTDEYLQILRRAWTSDEPFDFAGDHYRLEGAHSAIKPLQKPHIPIYFGGSSQAAIEVAGKHADTYALWGETHDQVRDTVARVRESAARHGRRVRFSLSLRPILADSEEAAWRRADTILERARELAERSGTGFQAPENEGSRRLLEAAARGERLDTRLWTAVAGLLGAKGNSTALVGTPEQVSDALLEYVDLGIETFLIRGFDPLEDAIDYGRSLIPLTREKVAARRGASERAAAPTA